MRLQPLGLEDLGCEVRTAYHKWVKWRSLYVTDPEGNNVEMVCYDGEEDNKN